MRMEKEPEIFFERRVKYDIPSETFTVVVTILIPVMPHNNCVVYSVLGAYELNGMPMRPTWGRFLVDKNARTSSVHFVANSLQDVMAMADQFEQECRLTVKNSAHKGGKNA